MHSIKKYVYFFTGSVSLVLGITGVFLPLLPTTPFLLLACFCYLRSSKRMYDWLINHRIFGTSIYGYLIYKAIPRKTKIGAVVFLWSMLVISMFLLASPHIRIFLAVVGIGVTFHLATLKTMTQQDVQALNNLKESRAQTLSKEE